MLNKWVNIFQLILNLSLWYGEIYRYVSKTSWEEAFKMYRKYIYISEFQVALKKCSVASCEWGKWDIEVLNRRPTAISMRTHAGSVEGEMFVCTWEDNLCLWTQTKYRFM